jgi:hypothetical protein
MPVLHDPGFLAMVLPNGRTAPLLLRMAEHKAGKARNATPPQRTRRCSVRGFTGATRSWAGAGAGGNQRQHLYRRRYDTRNRSVYLLSCNWEVGIEVKLLVNPVAQLKMYQLTV